MRHKRLKLCALLLLGLGLTSLQAQTLYVRQNTGSQTAIALDVVQKITFSTGNLNVRKTDNSFVSYVLSGLRYLTFKDFSTAINEQQFQIGNANLRIYPNPVIGVLSIDLTNTNNEEGNICVLGFDGKVLQTQMVQSRGVVTINLSHLSQGIYFLRYSGADEIKIVKIIKQ